MRKTIAILLSLMMLFAFAACGSDKSQEEEQPTQAEKTHIVSGIVDSLDAGVLTICSGTGEEVSFNVENAQINSAAEVQRGDRASVEYSGKITGGDASECDVVKVDNQEAKEVTLEGKVKAKSDNGDSVTLDSEGQDIKFNTMSVKDEVKNVKAGDTVELVYAGIIENNDTTHAYVRDIQVKKAEKKTEATKAPSIKAVSEPVWAKTDVNVRSESNTSAKKVGELKKGTKVTRTGVVDNGWSRIKYENKDAFVSSEYLTKKSPAKKEVKKETQKAAEKTKAPAPKPETTPAPKPTEKPAVEPTAKPMVEPSEEPTEEQTEPPTEEQTEPPTEEPAEPETSSTKGVVVSYENGKIELDNGSKYNTNNAKIDGEIAEGQTVNIEYNKDTNDAIHIYIVDGAKAVDGNDSSSGSILPFAIIIGLLGIAAVVVIVVVQERKRKKLNS